MKKMILAVSALAFAATLGVSVPVFAGNGGNETSITAGGEQDVVEKRKRKKARKGSGGAGSGSGSGSGSGR